MNLREPLRTSRPETVYLHLTKRCNLDCIYCYFDAGKSMKSELSLGDLAKLFRDIVLLGPKKLVFTGVNPCCVVIFLILLVSSVKLMWESKPASV